MLRSRKLLISLLSLFTSVISLSGCNKEDTLLFLNWGEYISEELVEAFEEKYNCHLIVDIAESNELFYAKLKSGTTKYDLCCPSDYMIEKMYIKDLLQPIDFTRLENYSEGIYMDEVNQIIDYIDSSIPSLKEDYEKGTINSYHVPYFWGTFGLMYNKNNPYFKDKDNNFKPDVFENNNAWDLYFFDSEVASENAIPNNAKVGMYNVSRFTYASAMIYDQENPNAILNEENQEKFKNILSRKQYTMWGGDTLKHQIVANNLDIAFNYTGDCLDMAYVKIQDGYNFEDLSFYTYTPETTIAHVDSLVIPKEARHTDLAHKFIDFMLDPANEWLNSRNVGYCPPLQETYDMIVEGRTPDKDLYPYAYVEKNDEELHWLENWGKAIKTTYPLDEQKHSLNKGIPLTYFDSEDLKILNNIINNIKTS